MDKDTNKNSTSDSNINVKSTSWKTGSNQSSPNIKRNSGQFDVTPLSPKLGSGDSQVPRRLSQLFTPPSEEELANDDNQVNEATSLLIESSEKKVVLVPVPKKSIEEIVPDDLIDRISVIDSVENEPKSSSNLGSSVHSSNHDCSSSTSSSSSDEQNEEFGSKAADYASWDDTICSNRSSYFKHYYQKYSTSLVPSRPSTRASSHNSLVSLIREKNKMATAVGTTKEDDKKKRRENRGLMALVIFLFLVLVIGISLIYHFYNKHLENLSLFKKLKFTEDKRLLNLFDSSGNISIQAQLGTTLTAYSTPDDCTVYLNYLANMRVRVEKSTSKMMENETDSGTSFKYGQNHDNDFQFDDETVCLDWANQARIQIHRAPTSKEFVNCYNVFWSAHYPGLDLQDCLHISSPEFGVWWGIGDITKGGYPLETVEIPSFPINTGQLGRDPWGRILRRIFVSSQGGLLMLPNHLSASISISKDELCVAVNVSNQFDKTIPLTLNYTVCASPNITSTMMYLNHLAGIDNSSYSSDTSIRDSILDRIENPVWIVNDTNLTQKSVMAFVDDILAYNESLWGHILLPQNWQKSSGIFVFDSEKFPDSQDLSNDLRLNGFELALTISPLVATGTEAFKKGAEEGLFVHQTGSNLPVLISQDSLITGALTDFTNPRAVDWFQKRIRAIMSDYNVSKFHLHPPDSNSIPVFHEFYEFISSPDLALEMFLETVSKVTSPLSTDGIIIPPPPPTFVTLGGIPEGGWESLASLIPRILTLTMLGFPLIDAGIIGGMPEEGQILPEEELYVRWAQAASFLPAFQMSIVPTSYNEQTEAIISMCFQTRAEYIIPRFRAILGDTLRNNSALISPLALLYPDDPIAAQISDEWIIGTDLLVAPILVKGQTTKRIYIPDGMWENIFNGNWKNGPGWAEISVNLTDLPFFVKRSYDDLSIKLGR